MFVREPASTASIPVPVSEAMPSRKSPELRTPLNPITVALAGSPTRTAATRARPDPVSTAFVKCVVPITTRNVRPSTEHASERSQHAGGHVFRGPGLDLGEHPAPRISTASVWVPPTSTPTRALPMQSTIAVQHRVIQRGNRPHRKRCRA